MSLIEKIGFGIGAGFSCLALLVGLSALFALPVWWLWNALSPDLFGLPTIGFMQAWGLSLLCRCLFTQTTSVSTKS